MRTNIAILAACLLAACSGETNKTTVADSTNSIATDTTKAHPADPYHDQLNAQDTLFEDGSIPTSWENAGFNNPSAFKQFVINFKTWVKQDSIDSIAAHIRFPVKAAKNTADFKSKYQGLFTPALKNAVDSQRLDRLFRNFQGAAIGNGKIWFTESKGTYFITGINP